MTANRFRIRVQDNDKKIIVPIAQDFDEGLGREQQLKLWDRDQIEDNINPILDFETIRFSPDTLAPDKEIFYSLLFATQNTPNGNASMYSNDYSWAGIYYPDIVKRKNIFNKSFFKFDFYTYPFITELKISFSVIMPINNGLKVSRQISNDPNDPNYDPIGFATALSDDPNFTGGPYFYDVESSDFQLKSVGKSKENYYIQWLKDNFIVPDKNFYMSCRFFNALTGQVTRFINKPQPVDTNGNPIYTLAGQNYFFHRIKFNRANYTYKFYEYESGLWQNAPEIGDTLQNSIKFYEYLNP